MFFDKTMLDKIYSLDVLILPIKYPKNKRKINTMNMVNFHLFLINLKKYKSPKNDIKEDAFSTIMFFADNRSM